MKIFRVRYVSIFVVIALVIGVGFIHNANVWLNEGVATVAGKKSEYKILVDVTESRLYVLKDGVKFEEYKCAGGKPSTPSPIGTWTIVSKGKWNEGFGGSWMGFNVPWGKFGIHGTNQPNSIGWKSSHGCIRMYNDDVAKLYKYIPAGTKVTIVDGIYGVFGDGFRTLKSGMYGSDVQAIEKKLKADGFYHGATTGYFSATLEDAIFRWEKANNMPKTNVISTAMQKKMGFVLME